ncbi:MAG: hypothetical protein ACRDJH_07215 [Thermomicrobiales bacterium]
MELHDTRMLGGMTRGGWNAVAVALLAVGLVAAIAMDGDVPATVTKGLLVGLLGLDFVMIRWLIGLNGN